VSRWFYQFFKTAKAAGCFLGTMKDLAQRFLEKPLLLPKDLQPSAEGLQIISLLNPGVFRCQNKT
jgi:hypothetical protein